MNLTRSIFLYSVHFFIGIFICPLALSYPIEVSHFETEGHLYVESSSIKKNQNFVNLTYFENFIQPRQYGSRTYTSKSTYVRINCTDQVIYPFSESCYSKADLSGNLLIQLPIDDMYGSYVEPGSWVADVVKIGCGN
jgi:hypothetical protein